MKPDLGKWANIMFQLLILAALYILFYKHGKTEEALKEYWENKNFKTDSVTVHVDYTKLPKPIYKFTVPPAVSFDYTKIPASVYSTKITMDDSLLRVIDTLKKQMTVINQNYLKIEPTKPKLLYGEFKPDSLRLDLLGIDGKIRSNRYGVNYQRFRYQWVDGELKADPIKGIKLKPFTTALYAYTGYDLTNSSALLGTDYSLYYRRIRVSADSWVTIKQQPDFYLRGTIGLKFR